MSKPSPVFIVISSTLLVASLAVIAYALFFNSNDVVVSNEPQTIDQIDFSPATEEDAKISEDIKKNTDSTEDNVNINTDYNVLITSTVYSADDKELRVGVLVNGTQSGQCDFTISDGTIEKTETSTVLPGNGSSGCTARVNTESLLDSADWTVVVSVTEDGQTSPNDTKVLLGSER